MPPRTYIVDLAPNQLVEGVFSIQNCQLGLTRNGKSYLKCLLADRTGRTPGRMWNIADDLIDCLPTNGFVELQGQTQPYQGEMQIIIQRVRAVTPRPDDLLDLLPSTNRDIDDMFAQVERIIGSMTSPSLKALARAYLNDAELMDRFKRAPAAMQLHHAYIGGLLEHTLQLLRLGESILPLYPKLNRDLVLTGLFIHDLGKCEELTWETGFGYTDDGQLVGHVARGLIWLERKAGECNARGNAISAELLRVLHHMILSHHGVPEFGALKIPATPEAILVSQLDNLDAKTQMGIDAAAAPGKGEALGGSFTEKVWALGTRIYRPDPLADEEQAKPEFDAPEAKPEPEPATAAATQRATDEGETRGAGGDVAKQLKFAREPQVKGGI